jgi:predicted nucleic acid-binding protein
VTALDTSVSIPALLSWHEHHDRCASMAQGARIPAHALVETYSVLTRLPTPHRLDGPTAARLLGARFQEDDVLVPRPLLVRTLPATLAGAAIEGGASYDALVGLTARMHGSTLLTRDERAARTYDALDIAYELVPD